MALLKLDNMESGSWKRPISFELDHNEILVLLGRNGSGKTTLLNTIAGLIPVNRGNIFFKDTDITKMNEIKRTELGIRIALEGRQIFPRLSVKKNLLLGGYIQNKNGMTYG